MKKLKKYLKGFTLVELIIVITILAILATIAFVSFQNYTKDARDSSRVTTFSNLNNGFEIFFTKVGNYPQPDSPVSYTGGNTTIQMGIVGDNVSKLIGINTIPKDPLTNQNYIYSLGGNGYYYQIAGEKENTQASMFTSVYAAGETKLPIVKGNYKMDPSLPSLIPVKTSITSSGIFDPNVCFIVDGGSNNFASTSSNCIKKKDISLKTLDSSLLGYWDMETLSGTMLKDLSGNGNDGVGNGGILIGGTGGVLGKGTFFNGGGNYLEILDNGGDNLDMGKKDFTISFISKYQTGGFIGRLLNKGGAWNHNSIGYEIYFGVSSPQVIGTTNKGYGDNDSRRFTRYINNNYFAENIYYNITFVFDRNNKILLYINGMEITNSEIEFTSFKDFKDIDITNSNNLVIGSRTWESKYFIGVIDDIKIYNRALTDQEIAQQAKMAGF